MKRVHSTSWLTPYEYLSKDFYGQECEGGETSSSRRVGGPGISTGEERIRNAIQAEI
jgi:hypothetical protein